mmetsp:Transcript_28455/g.92213  ORF Transcript_28455/g.92213 Transcript_28455/m.92213 type:complete len:501 (-) Transcript_28455:284-1786(-)
MQTVLIDRLQLHLRVVAHGRDHGQTQLRLLLQHDAARGSESPLGHLAVAHQLRLPAQTGLRRLVRLAHLWPVLHAERVLLREWRHAVLWVRRQTQRVVLAVQPVLRHLVAYHGAPQLQRAGRRVQVLVVRARQLHAHGPLRRTLAHEAQQAHHAGRLRRASHARRVRGRLTVHHHRAHGRAHVSRVALRRRPGRLRRRRRLTLGLRLERCVVLLRDHLGRVLAHARHARARRLGRLLLLLRLLGRQPPLELELRRLLLAGRDQLARLLHLARVLRSVLVALLQQPRHALRRGLHRLLRLAHSLAAPAARRTGRALLVHLHRVAQLKVRHARSVLAHRVAQRAAWLLLLRLLLLGLGSRLWLLRHSVPRVLLLLRRRRGCLRVLHLQLQVLQARRAGHARRLRAQQRRALRLLRRLLGVRRCLLHVLRSLLQLLGQLLRLLCGALRVLDRILLLGLGRLQLLAQALLLRHARLRAALALVHRRLQLRLRRRSLLRVRRHGH